MKKGPESKFRQKICTELKQCNAKIISIIGGVAQIGERIYGQEPGISDVIMVHKHTGIVFLEFKAKKGILSPIQKRFLQEVNERVPYSGFVVREGGKLENANGDVICSFTCGADLIRMIHLLEKLQ